MRLTRIALHILISVLLTILTQIGGFVYLLVLFLFNKYFHFFQSKRLKSLVFCLSFIFVYLFCTVVIVPPLARLNGRVPMPYFETSHLRPLNSLTWILNRNYVRPALKESVIDIAEKMNAKFPNTTINYLDANFPFVNGFPLIPHLSHCDGKKIYLSFCYIDNKTKLQTNNCPSFIGYGICEEPMTNEKNTADFCAGNGYFQYSFLKKIIPQTNKENYTFDLIRTKKLVEFCTSDQNIDKLFIEPHLKDRMKLSSDKIRFHGCRAVRHDDHIHIQIK